MESFKNQLLSIQEQEYSKEQLLSILLLISCLYKYYTVPLFLKLLLKGKSNPYKYLHK